MSHCEGEFFATEAISNSGGEMTYSWHDLDRIYKINKIVFIDGIWLWGIYAESNE